MQSISKTIASLIWAVVHRGGALILSFSTNIVMARLLMPEDFGTLSLLIIWVSVADAIIDGGLGSAIIQKSTVTRQDITTISLSNIGLSILCYITIYLASSTLEQHLGVPGLELYLNVLALSILFKGSYLAQASLLMRDMNFKKIAKLNFFANLLSSSLAILFAYLGYGLWSLIAKILINEFVLFCFYTPRSLGLNFRGFDLQTFKEMLRFGSFISLTNSLDFFYSNAISLLIGKRVSPTELGFFYQANSLESIPVNTTSMAIQQVMFPVFAKNQNDKPKIGYGLVKGYTLLTFVVFPILWFAANYAEVIIGLVYSSKWLSSTPLFVSLCYAGALNGIIHINRSALKSIGFSRDIFFIQLLSTFLCLFVAYCVESNETSFYVWLIVANAIINFILLAMAIKRHIKLPFLTQLLQPMINLGLVVMSYFASEFFLSFSDMSVGIVRLVVMTFLFGLIYLLAHFILKTTAFKIMVEMLKIRNK